jgi:small conductance mechanosensitive channel
MVSAVIEFSDLHTWLVTNGLVIVIVVVGGLLAARFVHWFSLLMELRLSARAQSQIQTELVSSEPTKYIHAAVQATDWAVRSVIYFLMTLLVLMRFNVPLTSLVAPATVIGVALGFGAQRIVQDVLAGFFIVTERQYGIGDVVRISQPGATVGVSGTVEEVTLRITRIRSLAGELIMIPNGQILQVANLSRDWSQVVIDLQIPLEKGPEKARAVIEAECVAFGEDPRYNALLLSPPQVTGFENISLGFVQLRVIAKTLPSRQWEVARHLRSRLVSKLSEEGLLSSSSASSIVQQVI